MNIELDLFMITDWRIGTGTGARGYADRLVQRDSVDASGSAPAAPIVPAKTLVGVWRDACELAAHALDEGPSGGWHDWVEFLFGGQYRVGDDPVRPAALALDGPLRLPGRLPALLSARPRVAWAATFRKPGVAIDPKTGAAEDRKLRFEEMARAGVRLSGQACVRGFEALDEAQQQAVLALLAAGAQLLDGIGGKRRRGAGRCRLTLRGVSPDFAVLAVPPAAVPPAVPSTSGSSESGDGPTGAALCADRPSPSASASPAVSAGARQSVGTGPSTSHRRTAETGWDRVELVITVVEPVLIGAVVQGNLVRGMSCLPGWCLMPEVARRLGGPAHAMVRAGDLVVTAATPQSPCGSRTLPVPRVFRHAKEDKNVVVGNRMAGDGAPGKSYREGYLVVEGADTGTVVHPGFVLRMHNTIDDHVQRPTREVGGVYIYQALAAGTVFRAEVRARSGRLEPGWEERLAERWRVGRSSKDDYGQIRVEARPVVAPAATQVDRRPREEAADVLRVWLLSDLLVRDRRLRPSTDPDDVARALEQALARAGSPGVRLTPVLDGDVGQVAAALGAHRTESWHRGWGLPRSTLYGLATGSCLTFRIEGGPVAPETLDELRSAGVGERRAEGFGQVEIDHELLLRSVDDWPVPVAAPDATPDAAPVSGTEENTPDVVAKGFVGEGFSGAAVVSEGPLAPDEDGYTEGMIFERAAWRVETHRRCEAIMADPGQRARILPIDIPSSQVNGLREVAAEPTLSGARHRLSWLTRPRAGRSVWPKEKVRALDRLLAETDPVWAMLGLPEEQLTVTADGAPALRAELHHEAVRVLITSCVAAHVRAEAARRSAAMRRGEASAGRTAAASERGPAQERSRA